VSGVSHRGWEPAHLSYSTVAGYRDCGMRTLLQKVHQIEQHPGLAALGGNTVHTASEWHDLGDARPADELWADAWAYNLADYQKRSPSFRPEDYIATGRAGVAYGGKRNWEWWQDNGPGMVQAWIDWRTEHQWQVWFTDDDTPGIELDVRVELPGNGIVMQMHLDRVFVTPAGALVVLDLKTGRTPETAEQLGLYACGLELAHGLRPDFGYYWHPDKGHGQPLGLTPYTVTYFEQVTSAAAAGMNAGCFLAKPANNCRTWCGVSRACPAVGGAEVPPDLFG
jgi:PD-(D/E)XK nuclease superfamily